MRKLYLSVVSCVALVAFMGLSATAYGLSDPRCTADGNPTEILDFQITSPESQKAYDNSNIVGSAYACGSNIGWFSGAGTLYNHADVGVPDSVQIADSDLVPNGSRSASAFVNVLYHDPFGGAHFDAGVPSDVSTADKAECQNELDNEIVGSTPGNEPGSEIVTCLYGTNPAGENWSWAVRDADGKLWLTIGPMHGPFGIEPGLTYVNLDLCAYYGAVGSLECGTDNNEPVGEIGPDQWQQKNGCTGVKSDGTLSQTTYTVTATKENGTETPVAETSVSWSPGIADAPRGGPQPIPSVPGGPVVGQWPNSPSTGGPYKYQGQKKGKEGKGGPYAISLNRC